MKKKLIILGVIVTTLVGLLIYIAVLQNKLIDYELMNDEYLDKIQQLEEKIKDSNKIIQEQNKLIKQINNEKDTLRLEKQKIKIIYKERIKGADSLSADGLIVTFRDIFTKHSIGTDSNIVGK